MLQSFSRKLFQRYPFVNLSLYSDMNVSLTPFTLQVSRRLTSDGDINVVAASVAFDVAGGASVAAGGCAGDVLEDERGGGLEDASTGGGW